MSQKVTISNTKKVHFIGIGGISMNGLAQILYYDGYTVSGSDNKASDVTERLQRMGIEVKVPCSAENINDSHDLIVFTDAVQPDNAEYMHAVELGIPTMGRAQLIKILTQAYNRTVCVAGSHGKTTTSALLADVVAEAGLDPSVHIGGHALSGINNRIGDSPYFILEACEYKNNFLNWHPFVGVILNIDIDHNDFYRGLEGLVDSFAQFARNIHPDGALVINAETQGYTRIVRDLSCRVAAFGPEACFRNDMISYHFMFYPTNIAYSAAGQPSFDVMKGGEYLIRVELPLVGAHNIMNALACFAAADVLEIPPQATKRALENAPGVKRRYEYKGEFNGVPIIDDYAHHPTEIRACLAAARKGHSGRIVCVFQPHLYSRTRDLLDDFANSFNDADKILLLPIYAAREDFNPNISSETLCEQMKQLKLDVECLSNIYTAEHWLRANLTSGDMLLTVGAGDVYFTGERLL